MDDFEDSKTALVAECDCTVNADLCSKHNIKGYPTIKYGNPNDLQDYSGGRTIEDLREFAKTNLGPYCGPENPEICNENDKNVLDELMGMDVDNLKEMIGKREMAIQDAEKTFKTELEKLQSMYETLVKDKESQIDAVKDSKFGILKSVYAHQSSLDMSEGKDL